MITGLAWYLRTLRRYLVSTTSGLGEAVVSRVGVDKGRNPNQSQNMLACVHPQPALWALGATVTAWHFYKIDYIISMEQYTKGEWIPVQCDCLGGAGSGQAHVLMWPPGVVGSRSCCMLHAGVPRLPPLRPSNKPCSSSAHPCAHPPTLQARCTPMASSPVAALSSAASATISCEELIAGI